MKKIAFLAALLFVMASCGSRNAAVDAETVEVADTTVVDVDTLAVDTLAVDTTLVVNAE